MIGDLPNNLLELAPKFMVYLISFVVIGGAWGAHQRMLKQIKRGDGLLVWFNLFCLLFVALLPASAALLGRYPTAFLAITCFALDVALIQLTTLWLWRHASRRDLINPTLDPRVVKSIGRRRTSARSFLRYPFRWRFGIYGSPICSGSDYSSCFSPRTGFPGSRWPGCSKPHFHWMV